MQQHNRASLDTNVLLRFVLGDVKEQSVKINALLAQDMKFDIADAAIFEAIFVLESVYNMKRVDVVQNILTIISHSKFICNKMLFSKALKKYEEVPQLSIIDCALVEYARLNKSTPLYSFDKKLVNTSDGDAKIPA
jgi:predicted nucleic-acid-binding protein